MSATDGDLVEDYLDQLYAGLRGSPRRGRRLLAEAEDHLRQGVAEGLAAGLSQREAQEAAISSFGSVRAVVRAHQVQRQRVPGLAVLADLVMSAWKLGSIGLLAVGASGLVVAGMNAAVRPVIRRGGGGGHQAARRRLPVLAQHLAARALLRPGVHAGEQFRRGDAARGGRPPRPGPAGRLPAGPAPEGAPWLGTRGTAGRLHADDRGQPVRRGRAGPDLARPEAAAGPPLSGGSPVPASTSAGRSWPSSWRRPTAGRCSARCSGAPGTDSRPPAAGGPLAGLATPPRGEQVSRERGGHLARDWTRWPGGRRPG